MGTALEYRSQALAHLPPGPAFTREPGSQLAQVYLALAAELVRIEGRMQDALEEADPRTTVELLPEWEDAYGIPGDCDAGATTPALRRSQLVAKVSSSGGQSRAYLQQVAASIGWPIEIEEHTPFRCDVNAAGDAVSDGYVFVFTVHAPPYVPTFFEAGRSVAGDSLQESSNALLECTIDAVKPAHTKALYAYDGEALLTWAPWEVVAPPPATVEFVAIPVTVAVA